LVLSVFTTLSIAGVVVESVITLIVESVVEAVSVPPLLHDANAVATNAIITIVFFILFFFLFYKLNVRLKF
jgi:hypothetical protein